MNFDETLCYIAADLIAEAFPAQRIKHRASEGIFILLDCNDGLTGSKMSWEIKANYDSNDFPIHRLRPGECVCPPWMDCYCGGIRMERKVALPRIGTSI